MEMKTFKHLNALHYVNWPVNNVLAFTTTRINPFLPVFRENSTVLTSPYGMFNLGLHVGDDKNLVLNHRKNIECQLLSSQKIQWFEQVHGCDVVNVLSYQNTPIKADAAVTDNPAVALAIMTADCLPILLTNKTGSEIAAIHAGWRPLQQNIIVKTLDKMNTDTPDVIAWLGPCISPSVFEVGEEVRQAFINLDIDLSKQFRLTSHGKYLGNLHGIAQYLLRKAGVQCISSLDECTFKNEKKYYSYRRDKITGRMASIIAIKS